MTEEISDKVFGYRMKEIYKSAPEHRNRIHQVIRCAYEEDLVKGDELIFYLQSP